MFERDHMTRTLNNAQRGSGPRELSTGFAGEMHKKRGLGTTCMPWCSRLDREWERNEDRASALRPRVPMQEEVW